MKGHEGEICSIACSKSGNLVATGECFSSNQVAALIVWDFKAGDMLFRVRYHKQMIQNLSFSCNDKYLLSLGGQADSNQIVCWNMKEGKSEACQYATDQNNQECTDIKFYNRDPTRFVTVHNNSIKFWRLDPKTSRFSNFDIQLG